MTRIDATIISQKILCVISVYGLFRFFMKTSYLECRKNNKIRKTSSATNLPDFYFRYSLNILNTVLYGQHLFPKMIKCCIQFIHIIIFMFNNFVSSILGMQITVVEVLSMEDTLMDGESYLIIGSGCTNRRWIYRQCERFRSRDMISPGNECPAMPLTCFSVNTSKPKRCPIILHTIFPIGISSQSM